MKKLISLIFLLCVMLFPFYAFAEDIPSLNEISFKGAEINEKFSPEEHEYTLMLENERVSPTLESYKIEGSANLFVNYNLDAAKHQTGITVTLEYSDGSSAYTFNYVNAGYDTESSNNYLKDISCAYCEVYPKVSTKVSSYRLYIPSDLTVLKITTVTQDVNAYCDLPKLISLSPEQEPELSVTVTAANGKTRAYKLKIRRIGKTTEEVAEEMQKKGTNTFAKSELFYRRPEFIITASAVVFGAAFIVAMLGILKRIAIKAEDSDEIEFFD